MIDFRLSVGWLLALGLTLAVSCSRSEESGIAVATPTVQLSKSKAPLGSPIDVTYRFEVSDAPALQEDYWVFVHFLDGDEEMMWTDDHLPPVPTSQWKPGQVVEYTRTQFVPIYPYIGRASVRVGLYSAKDGRRLPLDADDVGQRSYQAASLDLLPQSDSIFLIYKDGWHPAEVAPENSLVEWQWTKKAATIAFRNPRRDCLFYLHADNPGSAFSEPQVVQVVLNGEVVEQFTLTPREEVVQRIRLPGDRMGTGDTVELQIQVDKTYVPARLPAAGSRDSRELGVRVFHAYVEPSQG
jgi:hypothetical protein